MDALRISTGALALLLTLALGACQTGPYSGGGLVAGETGALPAPTIRGGSGGDAEVVSAANDPLASAPLAPASDELRTPEQGGPRAGDVVSAPMTPPPTRQFDAATPTFRFEVGDEIEVSVWQEKELTTTHRVLRDGTVPARAVGPVRVLGRTIDEVHTELETRYAKFLVDPRVSIKVVSVHAERAFILGQVAKPAAIPLGGRMTLMQGLALAGGLSAGGDLQTIRVVRSRAGMRPRVFTVNADSMMKGQARSFLLQPGDVVFVHPTGLAEWSSRMTAILSPVNAALSGLGSIATAAAIAFN